MASYPKPLLQKTLEKRYQKINPGTREFLRKYFTASAKLYGVIFLNESYDMYKNLMQERKARGLEEEAYVQGITWDEFADFSSVARRDGDVGFYVYELQEVFGDSENSMENRVIILKDMVYQKHYYKFNDVYALLDRQGDKDFFIPIKFLDYARDVMTPAGKKLSKFFKGLKSTALKIPVFPKDIDGEITVYNKFKGTYLKNIHSLLRKDELLFEKVNMSKIHISDRKRVFNADGTYKSFADQMFSLIVETEQDPFVEPMEAIELYLDELTMMGVELNEKQMNEFAELFKKYHNTVRLRINRGSTAYELFGEKRRENPNFVPKIVFGGGYREMLRNGDMDLNEMRDTVLNDDKISLPMKKSILDGLKDLENKIR